MHEDIDPRVLLADVNRHLTRIKDADTPQNEIRLRTELEKRGIKLATIRDAGAGRFKVTLPKGEHLEEITLADAEDILEKLKSFEARRRTEH